MTARYDEKMLYTIPGAKSTFAQGRQFRGPSCGNPTCGRPYERHAIITKMSFAGAKVLSLESRRSKEIAQLIRNHQGDPFVAPSMREAPLDRNDAAFEFAEKLFGGA